MLDRNVDGDDATASVLDTVDVRVRPVRAAVLLLVDGRVARVPVQLLGDNLSVRVPRDQRAHDHRLVLPGLLRRLPLLGGHPVPLPHRLPGGRGAADGRNEAAAALHELDDILHRLPVPAAAGLFIPVNRFQFDFALLSPRENLSILGVHGPHRAPHQLPEPVPLRGAHPLPAGDLPLERVPVPHHLQEQRVRVEELGLPRHRVVGRGEAVPAELLLVHAGADHHRRPAAAPLQGRVRVRHRPAAVRADAVRDGARPRGEHRDVGECSAEGVPR